MLFVTEIFHLRELARTTAALRVRNTEVSVIGILLLPVGVVMCDWPGFFFLFVCFFNYLLLNIYRLMNIYTD